MATEPKPIHLDDILRTELGEFGCYQCFNFFLIAIPVIIAAFKSEYIFSAAAIPHRCQIPECGEKSKDELFNPGWLSNAVPTTDDDEWASCERFSPVSGAPNGSLNYCPAKIFDHQKTQPCDGYVYAHKNSVVYDFDLGCKEWTRALAGTFNMVGTLLVLPICGYVSDNFGRRVALVLSVFNFGLFGLIRAFSINYPMYLAMQFLQSTLGGGIYSSAFILTTELVGPTYRVRTGASCASVFTSGQIVLGLVAWMVQPWRQMLMVLHIPCFFLLSYYWILTESVRWLLSQQRYSDARRVLLKVAKCNNKNISEESLRGLTSPPAPQNVTPKKLSLIKTICGSKVLLQRVCTTPVWWITTTLIYYGLSINSVYLSDEKYLSYILVVAVEIPGYFTSCLVLDRFGRKMSLSCSYLLSATCNIALTFLSKDLLNLRIVLYLGGKYLISLVFSSLYLYTSELYPTEYRHTLLAFSSMVGRLGSIVAPLTPALKIYWEDLPSLIFGIMGLLAGLLVLTQPETLGRKMPDTLGQAEALGRTDDLSRSHRYPSVSR